MRDVDGDALIALTRRKRKLKEALAATKYSDKVEELKYALTRIDEAIDGLAHRIRLAQEERMYTAEYKLQERHEAIEKIKAHQNDRDRKKKEYHAKLAKIKRNAKAAEDHGASMTIALIAVSLVASIGVAYFLWSTSHIPGQYL